MFNEKNYYNALNKGDWEGIRKYLDVADGVHSKDGYCYFYMIPTSSQISMAQIKGKFDPLFKSHGLNFELHKTTLEDCPGGVALRVLEKDVIDLPEKDWHFVSSIGRDAIIREKDMTIEALKKQLSEVRKLSEKLIIRRSELKRALGK